MKKFMYVSLALGLALAFTCAKKPGTIEGKATLDGAATGNAGITISVAGTALTTATDDSGTYTINGVPAGQYTLEAKKEGYDSKPLMGILVEGGKILTEQNINLSKIIPPAPQGVTAPAAPAPAVAKEVVNINTATAEQLCLLPGITKKLAKAIIAHRKKGEFKSAEDLQAVKGITVKELAKIKDLVVVAGETTMKPAEKAAQKKKATHKKEAAWKNK